MNQIDVYEILIAEHELMLQSYVLGIVRDPFLAEDICQEAFVQGFKQLSTLKNKAAFAPWLRVIARNLAFAELRHRKLEVPTDPEVMLGMEDIFAALDSQHIPDTWAERSQIVAQCAEKLPEALRVSCRLYYYEGRLTKDIAVQLNASLATVLKRLERARTLIAECVQRQLRLGEI